MNTLTAALLGFLFSFHSWAGPTPVEDRRIDEAEVLEDAKRGLSRRVLADSFEPTSGEVLVALFDADSTLRVAPSGKVSANSDRDYFLLPFVTEKLAGLNRNKWLVVIASNQLGVGRHVSATDADGALAKMRRLITHFNPEAVVHYHDFAESDNADRKPGTGMLERLERKLRLKFGDKFPDIHIDRSRSFVCGDAAYKKGQYRPDGSEGTDISDSDRMLARNYGINFIDPSDFFEWVLRGGPIRFTTKAQVDAYFEAYPEYFVSGVSCPEDLRSEIPDSAKRKAPPTQPPSS